MNLTAQIAHPNDANDSVSEAFERLQKLIIEQAETIALRDKVIAARDHTINLLTEKMKALSNLKFGRKSERFDPTQQVLFDEAISMDIGEIEAQIEAALSPQSEASAELPNAKPAAKKPMAKPVRKPLPEHLERVIEHVPAQHCECPQCHGVLHQISEEISQKLAVKPPVYFVRQIIRPVMGCRSCEAAYSTPTQPEIINGGMPDPSLLAQILIHKYLDHLPLYRQSEIAKRSGIELPISTIAEWVGKSGVALIPLVDRLRKDLHRRGAIHADETPIQMLNPAPKTGGEPRAQNVQRAYLFAYRSAEIGTELIVIFDFQTSRAG